MVMVKARVGYQRLLKGRQIKTDRTGRAAQRLPSTAPTWVMMVTNDIRRLNSNFY